MFVMRAITAPPEVSVGCSSLTRVREIGDTVRRLPVNERVAVVRVLTPSHACQAVLAAENGISGKNRSFSENLLFCHQRSGFEAKLAALSEENTATSNQSERLERTGFLPSTQS
jgi:hypothetical protein